MQYFLKYLKHYEGMDKIQQLPTIKNSNAVFGKLISKEEPP